MDGHVSSQQQKRRSRHTGLQRCIVGLTLLLLLFEVVVSRLCTCLIIMVDSFHTLYLLFHLALLHLQTSQAPLHYPPDTSSSSSIAPPPSPANSADPEALHLPDPDPDTITDPLTSEHSTTTKNTNANPSSFSSSSTSLLSQPSVVARLQPVGALVSSLLVASLSVSVTHEILHHTMHPHLIQRPLLAVAASALSLLFNVAVLAFAWGHAATGSLGCDREGAWPSAEPNAVDGQLNDVSPSQQSNAFELEDDLSRVPEHTAHLGNSGNSASLYNIHPSTPLGAPPSTARFQRGTGRVLWARTTPLLRDLLCPCLALANALASLLLGDPHCHHHNPQESVPSCSSLVYLDPALSTVAVLALLAFALPEIHRSGLLLLQSRPPQLSVVELKRRLVAVQGVAGVHELHVWQLNESCWVASVHVHVHAPLLIQVVEGVTETLRRIGVSVCTVQPEVLTERAGGGETAVPPGEPGGPGGDWSCSLACGEKCKKMLCCSPATTPEDQRHHSL